MSANSELLTQISNEVVTCTKCPLSKTRCKAVPGEGSSKALVMFIGEGPGQNEDLQGRPFVGKAGMLLERLLQAIDLKREDVFITNVVKCRPPGNRDPLPLEIEACKNYLDRQIATINPRVIVTLGRYSMARYFPGKYISQIHGQYQVEGGRIVLPMYHPAAALRDMNGPTMAKFKEDGLTIPELLEKAKEIARTEIWGLSYAEADEPSKQVIAEEVAPPLQNNSPVVMQPTLQPAVETRPGEVTPIARVALPEPPVKNGRGHSNDPAKTAVITSSELADLKPATATRVETSAVVETVVATSAANLDEAMPPKRSRNRQPKIENSSDGEVENGSAENSDEVPKNGLKRRKKKEDIGLAQQLTLF